MSTTATALNSQTAQAMLRSLGAITTDAVNWRVAGKEEDITIVGNTDEVRFGPSELRELADVLEDGQVLVIDRSGSKARLTIE